MKDAVSVQRIQLLHPKFRDLATAFIEAVESATGFTWRIVEGFRSFAEQTAIYNEGRTTPGPNVRAGHPLGDVVTWAIAGTSFHNYGVAIDAIPFMPGSLTTLNWKFNLRSIEHIAVTLGLECGMDWPEPKTDSDHFENRYGLDWQDMLHKYTIKDFITGTQFINIS